MPKSSHRHKHNGASKYRNTRKKLQGGTTKQIQHVIHNMTKSAEAKAAAAVGSELPDRERGMYPKYQVTRLDGGTDPGGKHEHCDMFVLDLNHDPHATPALFSYATSARADGYELLAGELYAKIHPFIQKLEDAAKGELLDDIQASPVYEAMTDDAVKDAVAGLLAEELPPGKHAVRLVEELWARFDKLTQPKPKRKTPADTCPTCRHRKHPAGGCLNMASDNDCDCKHDSKPPRTRKKKDVPTETVKETA